MTSIIVALATAKINNFNTYFVTVYHGAMTSAVIRCFKFMILLWIAIILAPFDLFHSDFFFFFDTWYFLLDKMNFLPFNVLTVCVLNFGVLFQNKICFDDENQLKAVSFRNFPAKVSASKCFRFYCKLWPFWG